MMTKENAIVLVVMAMFIAVIATPLTWSALHIWAWEKQEDMFLDANRQGRHADAITAFEQRVDVAWSKFDLKLANKSAIDYAMPAAESYEHLGQTDQARRQYLRVLRWTPRQYEAYCSLNAGCDNDSLAAIAAVGR